ncbi:PLC-like phosphodiesterase [Sanghuangporus baumii]|uniref:Phosphoinositide phospholipase C n=1 Tax=Sanghuangporus baumii TaxID=108892 RepID=A0A9Q5N6W3_SANBA|nr:PLC-like phosphodiesterase [Sanghuangporus baumii]
MSTVSAGAPTHPGTNGHERRTEEYSCSQRATQAGAGDDAATPHPPSPSPIARPRTHNGNAQLPIVITSRQQSLGPPPGYALLKRTSNLLTASGEPSSRALREALEHAQARDPGSDFGGGGGGRSASLVSERENTITGKSRKVGVDGEGTSSPPSSSSSSSASSLNLGVLSLRRTLTEVKRKSGLALKRSLSSTKRSFVNNSSTSSSNLGNNSRSNSNNMDVKTKHGRSFSEVGRGSAAEQYPRRSATLPLSSDISEAPSSSSIDPEKTPLPSPTTQAEKSKAKPAKKMDAVGRVDADVKVPLLLQEGTPLTKVSAKKKKTVTFRIDPDQGYVLWESKKSGIIPIENIKEIRSGADARYYREQFQLSQEYEARWLTLVYIADGRYKTLHAVAPSPDVFHLWDRTLRALHAVRQELMSGLGHIETRQTVWEKRYWRGADEQRDDRLIFEEVEKMCRRLNLNFSRGDLMRRFEEADSRRRGYLDFEDFRKFVRLLKERPELTRLYKRLVGEKGDFDFVVFESFLRVFQKSKASREELEAMFRKHATPRSGLLPTPPPSDSSISSSVPPAPASEPANQGASEAVPSTDNASPPSSTSAPVVSKDNITPSTALSIASEPETKPSPPQPALSDLTLSLEGFTNFLLSTDNSAFADQNGKVWQDMTLPLSEYYISSSHNTYLVGHQLVGVSTIEGYIRALLHSCRSVEIDIYDGEYEPVIYHGKTFTSKVPLRDICQAIAKYAFVASPYPVIISAEVHCSLAQQDLVASIMRSVFGDALVSAPPDNRPPITKLPSPEELRGRVLLKAKNLYVTEREGLREKKITVDAESSESTTSSSSSSEASASDSEPIARDVKVELKRTLSKARNVDAVREIREEIQKPIKEIKEELSKARNLYERVRRKKSPPPTEGPLSPPKTPTQASTTPHPTSQGVSETAAAASTPGTVISSIERDRSKVKMSLELLTLLVYTVGVKCRGFNKKETYAPEHLFSLSERTANKVLKQSMLDLIKHNKTHLVRIYPNGTRLSSSNFEPHRYWAAGAQLVAINWQTFDLGYMINHSMFQRNGRAGYVLKPPALRDYNKELLAKRTNHVLDLTIISAQQLPRRKDSEGREIITDSIVDPYVEVSIHVPDWAHSPYRPDSPTISVFPAEAPTTSASTSDITAPAPPSSPPPSLPSPSPSSTSSTARTTTVRTGVIKNNGFNPVWEEPLSLPFDCVGEMFDLIFLRVAVRDERNDASDEPLAVYCVSLGSLKQGYRHLPLHDAQLSQYLFSTLFVHVNVRDV